MWLRCANRARKPVRGNFFLAGLEKICIFASDTFVGSEGGFVVVSGDDCARPVLAWSTTSPVDEELHASVREWLQGYEDQAGHAAGCFRRGVFRRAGGWGLPRGCRFGTGAPCDSWRMEVNGARCLYRHRVNAVVK